MQTVNKPIAPIMNDWQWAAIVHHYRDAMVNMTHAREAGNRDNEKYFAGKSYGIVNVIMIIVNCNISDALSMLAKGKLNAAMINSATKD